MSPKYFAYLDPSRRLEILDHFKRSFPDADYGDFDIECDSHLNEVFVIWKDPSCERLSHSPQTYAIRGNPISGYQFVRA